MAESSAYRTGRLVAKYRYLMGVALVILLLWLYPPYKPAGPAAQVALVSNVAAQPAVVRQPDPMAVKCTMGIETVMAQANAAIKKNDPSAAFALLYDCRLHMTDPRAKALMTAALVASNKQASYNSDQVQRDVKKARKQRGVNIGMTEQEVLDSSWGRPEKVNTTTNAYGSTAQWVYHGNYLYFENGLLRTIQN